MNKTSPKIQTFDPNEHGRDFVVGDIHGCYFELEKKLKENNFNDEHPTGHLLWGRSRIKTFRNHDEDENYYNEIEDIDEIFCGHTIMVDPIKIKNVNYIDCGAFIPHWLSERQIEKRKKAGKLKEARLIMQELK